MSTVNQVLMAPQGPTFSALVQGYWRMAGWGMNSQQHLSFLKQHVELGITTVDHAHVYGGKISCEALFGDALALDSSMRERIQIVSKCGIELVADGGRQVNHYDSTPAAITRSVETSLKRLNVEALDVLLVHRPDWLMDVDAMAQTFAQLKAAGKVQHFGVSNFTASQYSLLQSRLDAPLVTNQIEISPLSHAAIDDGRLDLLHEQQTRPMAWSCLAGGEIFNGRSERLNCIRACLQDIADELEVSNIEQIVYAWVMTLPSRPVPIIGSSQVARIQSAVSALSIRLSQEQWYRIWVAAAGQGVP